jgi:hypothetical protein
MLVIAVACGLPAAVMLYVRHTYSRDLSIARGAPKLTPTLPDGKTVFIDGRINNRTPVLKDGLAVYQESYTDRHTRADGSEKYVTRTRDHKQALWIDTTIGPVKVDGDYELSAGTMGYARIAIGETVAVTGCLARSEGTIFVHAGHVHQGTRESLIAFLVSRSGGGLSSLTIACALLLIGIYLIAINTGRF